MLTSKLSIFCKNWTKNEDVSPMLQKYTLRHPVLDVWPPLKKLNNPSVQVNV